LNFQIENYFFYYALLKVDFSDEDENEEFVKDSGNVRSKIKESYILNGSVSFDYPE